jgi:hypothetical protein
VRKSEHALEQARWRLYRKASKKEMSARPETLEFVQYVHVFTTHSSGSATEILVLYPKRWQIELVFKRLNSLIHLGHLPKHNDLSSRAWLHGKLLVGLLTQELIRVGGDISLPLGGTPSVSTTPRHWREFSFLLHQVQRAIEPQLPLSRTHFPIGKRSPEPSMNVAATGHRRSSRGQPEKRNCGCGKPVSGNEETMERVGGSCAI